MGDIGKEVHVHLVDMLLMLPLPLRRNSIDTHHTYTEVHPVEYINKDEQKHGIDTKCST